MMKKISFLIGVFFVFSTLVTYAQVLPDVKVENTRNEIISTKILVDGKPFILSFWGVTCKPCITELNTLNELLEEWREEVDFNIVAVSIDDSRFTARARSMAKGFGWDFICLFDKNQNLKRAMNVSLTPQTYIVDGNGKIVYSHSGYTPGSELELLEKLKELQKK
ncbi:TlpA family protein disulfide reductase [Bacteroides oleiciplenus]|uniref:Thioredoxin domain-containing protein n=2 Tax=Bacteroides oleiciplenus TaxID=626931 RepID=K9EI08_9BACE|nr:TlpA disulfide reductase family protein [Bacteroides oleiciplenus]EKU90612.1 hypothetical protein HMPREF9447_02030 [Bacteroides oleiciplenus YIT 12058]RGN39302.1 TlpA family protein disulfide reductase [Bacteroides oleiciplenus]